MFDNRWDNWAGDFADSPASMSLSPGIRPHVTDILRVFGEAMLTVEPDFPDSVTVSGLSKILRGGMPRFDIPEWNRSEVPEVIATFFEYLGESGRMGDAETWASEIRRGAGSYRERIKPGGVGKGVTIKKSEKVSPLGRNDPCPCGSGKKFKKCCMTHE